MTLAGYSLFRGEADMLKGCALWKQFFTDFAAGGQR
jgi:hypothetical protein